MDIIAKFNVAEVTKYGNGGGNKITLMPVIGDSEENKKFFKYTPGGKLELFTVRDDIFEEFKELGEFYVTITRENPYASTDTSNHLKSILNYTISNTAYIFRASSKMLFITVNGLY